MLSRRVAVVEYYYQRMDDPVDLLREIPPGGNQIQELFLGLMLEEFDTGAQVVPGRVLAGGV
jgi:hypothetical protein